MAKKSRYLRKARKYKTRLLARERAAEEGAEGGVVREDAEMDMRMSEGAMGGAEDGSLFLAQDAADDDTGFFAQDADDMTTSAPDAETERHACDAKTPATERTETATDTDADTAAKLATTVTDELEAYKAELAATKALLEEKQAELGATQTALAEQQRETELYKYNAETYHEKLEAVRRAGA